MEGIQHPTPIPRRIFVGGFDKQTTEEELDKVFQFCGRVVDANIVKETANNAYAFVTFMYEDSAAMVLSQKYSFFIRGHRLRVSPAYLRSKPRPTYLWSCVHHQCFQ